MHFVLYLLRIVVMDVFAINISLFISFLLKYDGNMTYIASSYGKNLLYILLAATAIKLLWFSLFRIYRNLWMYASIYEVIVLGVSLFAGNASIIALAVILQIPVPLSIFVMAFFIESLLIAGYRLCFRLNRLKGSLHIKNHKKSPVKRLMIIGGGEAGSVIVKELKQSAYSEGRAVAIIDDDKTKLGMKLHGVPIVGDRRDIVRVAKEMKIDEIIIAIPSAPKKEINEIYSECSKTDCKVRILPSIYRLIDGSVSIKMVRDVKIEDLLGRESVKVNLEEIASYLKDKVALVTGGGGSIGSELCRQIANFLPKQLVILDFYENSLYDIQNELKFKHPELNLKCVIGNIREKSRLENVFAEYRPDVVFHAAAHKHVPLMEDNPVEAIKNNVFGTLNMVECADKYNTSRFILISTDKAVNPTSVMGATKRIAEMIIQAAAKSSKTKFAAVRFGNVLGSKGSVIPLFKKQIEQGGPVTVTHPEMTRYFMTIPEAVQLVIQAGAMAEGGEIFVLDMGEPVNIYELARNLIKLSGYKPDEDIKIVFTGLRPGEKMHEELFMKEEILTATKHDKIFIAKPVFSDPALLKRELDILSDLLASSVDKAVEYMNTMMPQYKRA